ncbi:MAG: porin [Cyclobacteriaceae bacterium]
MKILSYINKYALVTVLALGAVVANAQDEEAGGISFSGTVDAYYRANLNGTNDAGSGLTTAPGTSFANLPGFSLGMINLVTGYEGEKAGFVADLAFGPRGNDAVFGSTVGSTPIVNQLYVYWNVSDKLTLTLGNFNTFLGYEVISPAGNFNYSTSYMFSYGPFSHSGLKADISLTDELTFMAAIMNPTDATDFNPSNDYVGGFQLGYSNDIGGAWLNGIVSDGFYQVDLTTGWDVTDAIYLGVNATNNSDFSGAALYAQTSLSDAFALGIRGEYFVDDSGVVLTAGESVLDFTVSANYTVGGLTFVPEFRIDAASADEFMVEGDPIADPVNVTYSNSLASFVLGAYYSF